MFLKLWLTRSASSSSRQAKISLSTRDKIAHPTSLPLGIQEKYSLINRRASYAHPATPKSKSP